MGLIVLCKSQSGAFASLGFWTTAAQDLELSGCWGFGQPQINGAGLGARSVLGDAAGGGTWGSLCRILAPGAADFCFCRGKKSSLLSGAGQCRLAVPGGRGEAGGGGVVYPLVPVPSCSWSWARVGLSRCAHGVGMGTPPPCPQSPRGRAKPEPCSKELPTISAHPFVNQGWHKLT